MNKRLLLFIPLVVTLGLGAFLFKGLFQDPKEIPSALLGKPFPAFELTALASPEQTLTAAELPKEPILVNVWATWCPSCKVEHEQLVKITRRDGIKIVGINYKDDRTAAQQWLQRYENPYSLNIFDPEGRLGLDLGVYGAPETYVVDAQGIIRYRYVGPVDETVWQELKGVLAQLEG